MPKISTIIKSPLVRTKKKAIFAADLEKFVNLKELTTATSYFDKRFFEVKDRVNRSQK